MSLLLLFNGGTAAQTISPTGLASAEAFGSDTVTPGPVTVSVTGIASAEVFGTAAVGSLIAPAGIASAEAFGSDTITPGPVTISPSGLTSAEAFGTAVVTTPQTVTVTGVASAEAFGAAVLATRQVISPNALASAEAFGTPSVGVPITYTSSPAFEVAVWVPDTNGLPQLTEILQNAIASTTKKTRDIGSGQLVLQSNDPKATDANLADNNLITIATDGVIRNGFFIDSAQDVGASPDASGDKRTVGGRDWPAILERARVHPPGWPLPGTRALASPILIPDTTAPFYQRFLALSGFVGQTSLYADVSPSFVGNASFETDVSGWSYLFSTGVTNPATSFAQLNSAPSGGGINSGEAVLTSTLHSGLLYPFTPTVFHAGITYQCAVWLKSISGTLNVRAGIASDGTPTDIAQSGSDITTSWALYTFTWTPTADRTDAEFFIRTNTASAATVAIDGVQVNQLPAFYQLGPSGGTTDNTEVIHASAIQTATTSGTEIDFTTEGGVAGLRLDHGVAEVITAVKGAVLAANTSIGATNLKVDDVEDFAVGDWITIGLSGQYETRQLTAVGTRGSGGTGLTFTTPLIYAHFTSDWVIGVPTGTATGSKRTFTNTLGYIFATLLGEAQGGSELPALHATFTTAHDSSGNPWSATATVEFSAGASLLDVWQTLIGLGWYTRFRFSNAYGGWKIVMDAYDADPGVDQTALVVLREGKHLSDAVTRTRQAMTHYTRVLVEGANGTFVEVIGTGETVSNRRDGYLSFTNTDDATTLQQAGQEFLDANSDESQSIAVPMFHGDGAGEYEPGDDFAEGDTIALDVPGMFSLAPYQVAAITWAVDANGAGRYTTEVDLNSQALTLEVRVKQQLDRLATKQVATSSIPTGGVGTDEIADGSIGASKLNEHDDYTMESLTITDTAPATGGVRFSGGGLSLPDVVVTAGAAIVAGTTVTSVLSQGVVAAPYGLIIPTGSGVPSSGLYTDGWVMYDAGDGRLYVTYSNTRHYFTQTAGFQIPKDVAGVDETVCGRCGRAMLPGERVIGRIDRTMSDGALHGLYEHERCPD